MPPSTSSPPGPPRRRARTARGLVGTATRLAVRELVEPAEHPEVLAPGQVLVDRRVLAGEADQLAHGLCVPKDVQIADRGAAGVEAEQRREDPHRRRLARAVRRAGRARFLPPPRGRRRPGAHLAPARAVDLDEPLCLDCGQGLNVVVTDGPAGCGRPYNRPRPDQHGCATRDVPGRVASWACARSSTAR